MSVNENLSKFLKSFCIYLQGKSWITEKYDFIITTLLSALGDEAFWALAESIYSQLSDYEYQTSMRNMQLLFNLKGCSNCREMEDLFDEELKAQKAWASGNGHFDVDLDEEHADIVFSNTPLTFYEMALYILLEQAGTQNARKMESSIYALYLLGLQFPQVMDIIIGLWTSLSQNQQECLLVVLTRWAVDGKCTDAMHRFVRDMYDNCAELTRKYYLHSILLKLQDPDIQSQTITFNAPMNGYKLPHDGIAERKSCYENFLSAIERHVEDPDIDDIRKYIFEISPLTRYVKDPYVADGDSGLPTINTLPGNIFYDKEKSGEWSSIPIAIKKAKLLPAEDPFLLTELPCMSFDENWFPSITIIHDKKEHEYLTTSDLSNITRYNVGEDEMVVASCLWYPWGHKDGTIYIQSSKIGLPHDAFMSDDLDSCIGNFGLLANENAMVESFDSGIGDGGVSLFNRVCGNLKLYFGNCQIAPSSIWRDCLDCTPTENNPYIWINQSGNTVLRFERIASPVRELLQEPYIRQPILFRWVYDKKWLNEVLRNNGLCLFHVCEQESYPRLTE